MSFSIDMGPTTELLARFHRTMMDRPRDLPWESFDAGDFDEVVVERARREWAHRSVAEYQSTAQFGQLLHRLTKVGAPVEMIGAATRLAVDECRHAELCARMADLLGGREGFDVPDAGLDLYEDIDDPWLAITMTILAVCCFGESLSIPMLESIHTVASAELPAEIAALIASDEEYHAHFGWEALTYLVARLDDRQRRAVEDRLPPLMGHFERVCSASPELLDELVGAELIIDEEEGNLGTLGRVQYAAIFYDTMETRILPTLSDLGFEAHTAWATRVVPGDTSPATEATSAAIAAD
jgi:hypothetical protein